MTKNLAFCIIFGVLFSGCNSIPLDKSAFAATAGQSTIVVGSCQSEFNLGWTQCLVEKGVNFKLSMLRFVSTNPAEWAVSDCENGIFKTGSTKEAGLIEVDLAPLSAQILANGICILKIEMIEKYPDPNDSKQFHSVYMRGGMFIETIEPGYIPTPSPDVMAFCTKVSRTTKGRTIVENCN